MGTQEAGAPRSATQTAAAVARGEASAVVLVEEALERITAGDGTVGAIAELRRDDALAEAVATDRGERPGPLCGVPVTIKEAIHVAGMRSTWGLHDAADHRAVGDAEVVARLRRAGAIVVGTTAVHEMLADVTRTTSPVHGRTSNPWDPDRRPGGSSGGAAAAVASGFSMLDVGSDLVGSLRVPASFCGVYGLKPTADTVPLAGFRPPGAPQTPDGSAYLSALGPLTRTAEDLATVLEVLTGRPLPGPAPERLEGLAVRAVLDDPRAPTAADVLTVLRRAVDAMDGAGAHVTEGWPAGVDPEAAFDAFGRHLFAFFDATDPSSGAPDPATLRDAPDRTGPREAWAEAFREVDVVVCPVFPVAAPLHDADDAHLGGASYEALPFWVAQPTLSGLPAASVPVGRTEGGLPVGLQVIGAEGHDRTVVAVARLLAGILPPPALVR